MPWVHFGNIDVAQCVANSETCLGDDEFSTALWTQMEPGWEACCALSSSHWASSFTSLRLLLLVSKQEYWCLSYNPWIYFQ